MPVRSARAYNVMTYRIGEDDGNRATRRRVVALQNVPTRLALRPGMGRRPRVHGVLATGMVRGPGMSRPAEFLVGVATYRGHREAPVSRAWSEGSDKRWREFRAWCLEQWHRQGRRECEVRGPKCTTAVQHVDHVVPLAMGGEKYNPLNCRPACEPCNTGRRVAVSEEPNPVRISNW